MRLVLGSHKMSESPLLPVRILKVRTEALTGFRHVHRLYGLTHTAVSGLHPQNGSSCGDGGANIHSKRRDG